MSRRPSPRSRSSTTGMSGADEVVAETFKVLVLGNSDVGKTSLIKLYTTGETAAKLMPTIGIDFTDVIVSVRGTKVRLRVWDTAGQERFYTFTKQFFRGTQGILLMYDITSMASYQTLMKWIQTIHEVGLNGVVVVMVGNKIDLSEKREVPFGTASKLASRHGYEYIETSAVTGRNTNRSFYKLAEGLIYSRGIFLPGEEADAHRRNTDTLGSQASDVVPRPLTPENGALRVEGRRRRAGSNRKQAGKEQTDSSFRCCS